MILNIEIESDTMRFLYMIRHTVLSLVGWEALVENNFGLLTC
jgi:hypothetical protein